MAVLKVGVLISGRGSNAMALIEAGLAHNYPARVATVISNRLEAPGLRFAHEAGIKTATVNHHSYAGREAFEREIDARLKEAGAQLVCLAGFMRVLSPWFTEQWRDRLINIHPSLLPAFPGLDTHKRALAAGVKFAGCTVHFVRAELDHGPIIAQAAVPVMPGDDEAKLAARVLEAEHKLYPQAVRLIAEGRVNIFEETVFIEGALAPVATLFNPVL
ncbi:MAG TPA: phosphoribosylglycinamide formyltransferase [Alphaproteobacteria bacterium]|nr:phosphoribosylglycinamide formyltransferase [Alphaproteobacteria bacterium]